MQLQYVDTQYKNMDIVTQNVCWGVRKSVEFFMQLKLHYQLKIDCSKIVYIRLQGICVCVSHSVMPDSLRPHGL